MKKVVQFLLLKVILSSLLMVISVTSVEGQNLQREFRASFSSSKYVYPDMEGGKIMMSFFSEDSIANLEIQLTTAGVRMVNPGMYGYSEEIDLVDDGSGKIYAYLYKKQIMLTGFEDSRTEVVYTYRDTSMADASEANRGAVLRVEDLDYEEYLTPMYGYPVIFDGYGQDIIYEYMIHLHRPINTLFDSDTMGNGTDIYYAHISDEPFNQGLSIKEYNDSMGVHWLMKGKIYYDSPQNGVPHQYQIWDTKFPSYAYINNWYWNSLIYRPSSIVLFDSSSVFEIREDSNLGAIGVTVSSGSTDMAQGIVVYPQAQLELYNSLVEDQMTGVTLIGDATLVLVNTYFTDNLVSIRVKPDPSNPGGIAKIIMNKVYFSGTGNLKTRPGGRHYPMAHIYVEDGAQVEIEVINDEGEVLMSDSDYGIYSEGSVRINGGTIDYTLKGFPSFGVGELGEFGFGSTRYYSGINISVAPYYSPTSPGIGIEMNRNGGSHSKLLASFVSGTEKTLRIAGATTGIRLLGVNALLNAVHIDSALHTGVEVRGMKPYQLAGMVNSVITAENTGIFMLGNENALQLFRDNQIYSRIGVDILQGMNSYASIESNEITSTQYGVLNRANARGLVNIIDNDFYSYSLSEGIFDNTAGILSRNSHRLHAEGNNIYLKGAKYGIYSLRSDHLNMISNDILLKKNSGYYSEGYGIKVVGGRGNQMSCNKVYQENVLHGTQTVSYLMEDAPRTILRSNNTDKVPTGIWFISENMDSEVRTNYFKDHGYGLQYGLNTFGGFPSVTGEQHYMGNQWYGANTLISGYKDARFFGLLQQAFRSRYVVNDVHNPVFGALSLPSAVEPVSGWFNPNTDKSNAVRGAGDCVVHELPAENMPSNFDHMVSDSIDFDYFDAGVKAEYYRRIYRESLNEYLPVGMNTSGLQTILTAKGVNKPLVAVANAIDHAFSGDALTGVQLAATDSYLQAIGAMLVDYVADTSMSSRLMTWSGIEELLEAVLDEGDGLYSINFGTLNSSLKGLTGLGGYTEAELVLYTAMEGLLAYASGDSSTYASLETDLKDIAASCPFELGSAVYIARGLIGDEFEYSHEDYEEFCSVTSPPPFREESVQRKLSVYPVPSSGLVRVDIPEGAERLELYGSDGKLYMEREVQASGALDLIVEHGGVYYLRVLVSGNYSEMRKVVILK